MWFCPSFSTVLNSGSTFLTNPSTAASDSTPSGKLEHHKPVQLLIVLPRAPGGVGFQPGDRLLDVILALNTTQRPEFAVQFLGGRRFCLLDRIQERLERFLGGV